MRKFFSWTLAGVCMLAIALFMAQQAFNSPIYKLQNTVLASASGWAVIQLEHPSKESACQAARKNFGFEEYYSEDGIMFTAVVWPNGTSAIFDQEHPNGVPGMAC